MFEPTVIYKNNQKSSNIYHISYISLVLVLVLVLVQKKKRVNDKRLFSINAYFKRKGHDTPNILLVINILIHTSSMLPSDAAYIQENKSNKEKRKGKVIHR